MDFKDLDDKTIDTFQDMYQKMRETINNTIKDEETRKEFFLVTSVQFFLYSLAPKNNRFLAIKDGDYENTLKRFKEILDLSVLGEIKENE